MRGSIGSLLPLLGVVAAGLAVGVPARAQVDLLLGGLEDGSSVTIEYVVPIDSPVTAGASQVCNQGTVSGTNVSPSVSTDDPDTAPPADPTCTPLAVEVDLLVSKSESVSTVVAGSGTGNLTHTVTVTNTSTDFSATGVTLSEVLTYPAGVAVDSVVPSQGSFVDPTWTVGTLGPGASATLTVTMTVAASAAAGTDAVCDTAVVAGVNEPQSSTGNDSATECTSVTREVDLQVSKTESADPVIAGSGASNLTYVVTVENAGPSAASAVTLSEVLTLPVGVAVDSVTPSVGSFADPTWTLGDLAAGASATLTVVLTVGPSAAAGTDVVCDTATVTGANETLVSTGDDSATECTSVAREVDLQVSKTESADPVTAGSGAGNLTYVVTVDNAGPSDASGVTLLEALTLPAGVAVGSVTPSVGSFADPTWTLGDLAAGASATLTVVLTVGPSAAVGADTICDTATVTGSNEPLVSTGDDTATECTSVARQVDIQVSKTESVDPAVAGDGAGNLTYVVTATNAGPSDASGLTLSETLTLPAGVTVDSVTPSVGSFVDPTWTLGDLAAGTSATLTVVLTVDASAAEGTDVICDTATLTAVNEPAVNPGDDSDTECTSITRAADLAIEKDDDADPPPPGADLAYTITVENLGPSNAANVVVTDPLPAEVTYVSDTCGGANVPPWTWNVGTLAVGATVSCDLVVSIDPTPPGSITNTATVTSDTFDDDTVNNSSSEGTTLDNVPPQVVSVGSTPATVGGTLEECETALASLSGLSVVFDEAMADPPGDGTAGDVTNPSSWLLVTPGPDLEFDSVGCGAVSGDDVAVSLPPGSVSYDSGTSTASLALPVPLDDGLYRLFACAALTDSAGNALDGDGNGTGGDDFRRGFRVDAGNRFVNGHFDCGIDGWAVVTAGGATLAHDPAVDADGSPESGSAGSGVPPPLVGGAAQAALGQCVDMGEEQGFSLGARFRLLSAPAETVSVTAACDFFAVAGCVGGPSGVGVTQTVIGGTGGLWQPIVFSGTTPPGTASGLCSLIFDAALGAVWEGWLDQARLLGAGAPLFADGFETGDTSQWSASVGE